MTQLRSYEVRDLLRQVEFPGSTRDIVSVGFVKAVSADGPRVVVKRMEDAILDVLYGASFAEVRVDTQAPFGEDSLLLGGGDMSPLQLEMLEDGVEPQPDVLVGDLRQAAARQQGGLGELDAPDGPRGPEDPRYLGALPVLQWDIDPHDPGAESVHTAVTSDGWEFRVWWQLHRGGELGYGSLQAMREDWAAHDGVARPHAVGRSEAVNLVYDRLRRG